jgi:hypothetical protein
MDLEEFHVSLSLRHKGQYDAMNTSDEQHIRDWQHHVKIMDRVYQNCTLDIAAAHGRGPTSGCFVHQSAASLMPLSSNTNRFLHQPSEFSRLDSG